MKQLMLWLMGFSLTFTSIAQNVQWHTPANYGLTLGGFRFEDVYFTGYKMGFAVSLIAQIYKTTDSGRSWILNPAVQYNGSHRCVEFLDGGEIGIVGGLGNPGKAFRTTDSGETWVNISATMPVNTDFGNKQICGLAHWGDTFYGVGWYGASKGRFYKSLDKGMTWQASIVDTSLVSGLVDIVFLSEDTGFATGTKTHDTGIPEAVVIKTTDGGQTWTRVFSDTTIGGRIWKIQFVNRQIAVCSIESSKLLFGDTVAIIRSTDGGDHWQIQGVGNRSSSMINMGTQGVGFATPLKGWVGGVYDGLFETNDGGVTWDTLNFGRNFNRFFVLDSNNIYASGHTIYRYGDTANFPLAISKQPLQPVNTLHPISPNPAKGKIVIEFDLVKSSNVVLNVVNLDTKLTCPIINRWHNPGYHRYEWDGVNYPDGLYMIILDNDDIPIAQKFILSH